MSRRRTVRLGDLCQVNPDKRDSSWPHSVMDYIDISSVGSGVLNEQPKAVLVSEAPNRAQRLVQAGDTIISTVRPNRRSFLYIGESAPATVVSTGFAVVRPGKDLDPRFLYYLVTDQTFTDYLIAHEEGSAYPAVNVDILGDAEITIPDLPEQHAIAHILGTLDDKIELNRRMNETLEAMARALFKSWFIDFDPVHAKAEGRDTGLPPDVAALFPDLFEDSELGELPVGWRIGTLGDFAELNPESWSAATIPNEVDYVDLANAKWGRIESTQRLPRKEAPSRARRVLRPGDTIVGTVRAGNGSYSFIAEDGLTGSTGFAVLRPRATAYAALIYLAATEHDNIARLAHLADGAAYPAVRPEVVLETRVVQPDRPIVEFFARCTRHIMEGQATNDAETRTLASLRDSLLPRLLSGELEPSSPADLIEESGRRVRHAM